MFEGIINGLLHALEGWNLLLIIFGTFLGIIFGSMPGLTATMGLALLVPFTFGMEPAAGLIMLAGIYVGAMYADAIPAILINTPGTPAAIATTFDGFPLAQKGKAQHALVTAAFASFVGSVIANIVLATLAEPLAELSLKFGPPEYFWLGIFGLTIISVLSSGSLLKGYLTGFIGLILSAVGMASLSGDARLTFGFPELQSGISLAGALIGFFCLPEILSTIIGKGQDNYTGEKIRPSLKILFATIYDLLKMPFLLIRSALIGLIVGIAPGAGGNIASMVSYSEATRWDKNPEEFGKGTIRGVAASEAANSAMAPGSLIPLLTLGIPGSPPAAIILGALMLHGMQPGVDLFATYGGITYTFMMGLFVAAFAILIFGSLGSFLFSLLINIPAKSLAPVILLMTVLGSYAIRNNLLDVWVMLIFGGIGFFLNKLSYHPAPLVLGFILGPYIEEGLVQSTMIGGAKGGVVFYMVSSPISIVLIGLCVITALWPILFRRRVLENQNKEKQETTHGSLNADVVMGLITLCMSAIVAWSIVDLSFYGVLFVNFCVYCTAILGIAIIFKGFFAPKKNGPSDNLSNCLEKFFNFLGNISRNCFFNALCCSPVTTLTVGFNGKNNSCVLSNIEST
ncbi:tripartite tricarboxylate transporter permease [SAR116 cluster bacterium]|nr:tripartite tricarboxylate transporter permease [SAR116 cluster bacterium]